MFKFQFKSALHSGLLLFKKILVLWVHFFFRGKKLYFRSVRAKKKKKTFEHSRALKEWKFLPSHQTFLNIVLTFVSWYGDLDTLRLRDTGIRNNGGNSCSKIARCGDCRTRRKRRWLNKVGFFSFSFFFIIFKEPKISGGFVRTILEFYWIEWSVNSCVSIICSWFCFVNFKLWLSFFSLICFEKSHQ